MELKSTITSVFKKAPLEFYVNGTKVELENPNPQGTRLDFIRSQDGLKGTKLGCGEGGCGACTVVLQTLDEREGKRGRVRHLAVNACLFPLVGGICHFNPTLNIFLTSKQSLENMSSQLKDSEIQKILTLYKKGWRNFMDLSKFQSRDQQSKCSQ
jgi:aerobic-type carbon monoxide dehydrogenase small subunit (CoxS/CutS family)